MPFPATPLRTTPSSPQAVPLRAAPLFTTPPSSPEWGFRQSAIPTGLLPPVPPVPPLVNEAIGRTPISLADGIGDASTAIPQGPSTPPGSGCRKWRRDTCAPPDWTPEPPPQQQQQPAPWPSPIPAAVSNTPTSPFMLFDSGAVFYGFTLRRADGVGLGMDVARSDGNRTLLVTSVLAGGAVEAWNRQVVGSQNAGKAVVPGDKIVRVNSCQGCCEGMLAECRDKLLVKLLLVRGGVDCEQLLAMQHDGVPPLPTKAMPQGTGSGVSVTSDEFAGRCDRLDATVDT